MLLLLFPSLAKFLETKYLPKDKHLGFLILGPIHHKQGEGINNGQTITKSSVLNKQSIKKANCLFKVNCVQSSNMQSYHKEKKSAASFLWGKIKFSQ